MAENDTPRGNATSNNMSGGNAGQQRPADEQADEQASVAPPAAS